LKRSEVCLFHKFERTEAKRSLFIPQIRKIEAERTRLIPEIGKIEAKKMNWIEVKRTEAVFLKTFWSPGIDSKELIPPAYALVGLYNNPIPAQFLALLKRLQIRAQATLDSRICSLESIPGVLKRLQIRAWATLGIPGMPKQYKSRTRDKHPIIHTTRISISSLHM
jgi:hypothetical protein